MDDIQKRQIEAIHRQMNAMKREISYVEKRIPDDRPADPEQLQKLVTVAQNLIRECYLLAGFQHGYSLKK